MDGTLKWKLLAGITIPSSVMGLVLFISAGTMHYWQAWLFLAIYSIITTVASLYFVRHDPDLVQRRMRVGPIAEKRMAQRVIMSCITIGFILLFVIAGIDHRLSWSHVPLALVLSGNVFLLVSFYIFYLVGKENTFASSTIEIAKEQKVITTGPYRFVRHPMYAGAILFLFAIPLALGSFWAVLVVLPLMPLLIWRIVDEEQLLVAGLDGYPQYCLKVKYRLIPGLY